MGRSPPLRFVIIIIVEVILVTDIIIVEVILVTDIIAIMMMARLPKRTVLVLSFVFELETEAEPRLLETPPSLLLLLPCRLLNR